MKCPICKMGETENGKTSVSFEQDNSIIFFKEVPAMICNNCGESYFSSEISEYSGLKCTIQSGLKCTTRSGAKCTTFDVCFL